MSRQLRIGEAVTVKVGTLLNDASAGSPDTEYTGTLVDGDVKIAKNGAAYAGRSDTTAPVHDTNGEFDLELDATDTNTEGELKVSINIADIYPFSQPFDVVTKMEEYQGGIWYDANATANTNTLVGRDGKPRNPVTGAAAALTLAANSGLRKIFVRGTFTLPSAADDIRFVAMTTDYRKNVVLLNSQNVNDCHFEGLQISGTATSFTDVSFLRCHFGGNDFQSTVAGIFLLKECSFSNATNYNFNGNEIYLEDCYSLIPDGAVTPTTLKFPQATGSPSIVVSNWSGKLRVGGLANANANMSLSAKNGSRVELLSTNTAGDIDITGGAKPTDNAGASVNVTFNPDYDVYQGYIWYNSAGSTGQVANINGTPDNPSSSEADAVALAIATGIKRIRILDGSSFSAGGAITNIEFSRAGNGGFNPNGQTVQDCTFLGMSIGSGNFNAGGNNVFYDCYFLTGVTSIRSALFVRCGFDGGGTYALTGQANLINCYTREINGNTKATINVSGITGQEYQIRDYNGDLDVGGMTDATEHAGINLTSGRLTLLASNTLGSIKISGTGFNLTDNSAGTTVNTDEYINPSDVVLTSQEVRDAMKLAPTGGSPAAGSIDEHLDDIQAQTDLLPADPASETNVDANEAKIDIIDSNVDAIKAKTDNLPADPASETNVDANEAKIDIIDTNVDAIKVKTDQLAFTAGNVNSNADAIDGSTDAAERLKELYAQAIAKGTINGGTPSTTMFQSNLTNPTGSLNGQALVFISGTANNLIQTRYIDTIVQPNGVITLKKAVTDTPAISDVFLVLGTSN